MTNLIGVSGKIGSNFRNIWKNIPFLFVYQEKYITFVR